jgi:zinc/manganese transport system substrate-binding protein
MRRNRVRVVVVRRLAATAAVAAVAATAACAGERGGGATAGPVADGPTVMATTSIVADLTARTACGELEVTPLVPEGTDAHEYEPSLRDADALGRASLVVAVGLGLEEGLTDALEQASAAGVRVVEIGPEVDPRPADPHDDDEGAPEVDPRPADPHDDEGAHRDDGGHGGRLDPHVWMDPDRMATAVGVIAEQLRSLDGLPLTADELDACAKNYQAELRSLAAEMDETLAAVPAPQRKLVTNHEALGYFAERFDFEVIGAVIPSTSSLGESNPRWLEELAGAVRDAGVSAVFAETTQPTDVARSLAERTGRDVEVVELYTETLGPPGSGADSYAGMMRTNAERVAAALAPGRAPAPGAADGG